MKKSIIYILVLAVLGAAAWWLVKKNQANSSIKQLEVEYDFGIPDTASITKIIISDKTPASVTLDRSSGKWVVNDQYNIRPDAIEVLLQTMNRMSMRSFVPQPSQETIISRLAVYGKEVKVYAGDELIKHFFVGTETPDQLGTYMMLANASQPFAVHIQGFNGYLNSRFFTEEELWRDRTLFGVAKDDIAEVSLTYTNDPGSSFTVDNTGERPILKDAKGATIGGWLDVNMNIFLGSFRTAKYEGMIIPSDGIYTRKDSLQSSTPEIVMGLTTTGGQPFTMNAHKKRPEREEVGEDGLPLEWDPNRMYAFMDDGRWVLIQYYGLRNIMVTKEFFGLELNMDN